MMSAFPQIRFDNRLQQRIIDHYSRMADWLETCPWYQDNDVVHAVRSIFPGKPSRVLELCCGAGLLLDALSNFYPDTNFIGIDISPVMANRARDRLSHRRNVHVLNQDWVYELPSTWDHAFDVVIVKNALHLFDDVSTKLKELKRVCHPWTTLIVVETVSPNAESNGFIKNLFSIVDSEHLKQVFFTSRSLAAALQEAGWMMRQSRPKYVRQHIDVERWLRQKCTDELAFVKARRLLTEMGNLRVRRFLDLDTHPGNMPSRMLRLQYIAAHVPRPAHESTEKAVAPELEQLQLI